jgi:hypothetical protein
MPWLNPFSKLLIFSTYAQKLLSLHPLPKVFTLNTPCKDPYVRRVAKDCVLSTTIEMVYRTIEHDVNTVLKNNVEQSHPSLGGNQVVIRKKPHVIDVALNQNTLHKRRYIMWMAIYTIPASTI